MPLGRDARPCTLTSRRRRPA